MTTFLTKIALFGLLLAPQLTPGAAYAQDAVASDAAQKIVPKLRVTLQMPAQVRRGGPAYAMILAENMGQLALLLPDASPAAEGMPTAEGAMEKRPRQKQWATFPDLDLLSPHPLPISLQVQTEDGKEVRAMQFPPVQAFWAINPAQAPYGRLVTYTTVEVGAPQMFVIDLGPWLSGLRAGQYLVTIGLYPFERNEPLRIEPVRLHIADGVDPENQPRIQRGTQPPEETAPVQETVPLNPAISPLFSAARNMACRLLGQDQTRGSELAGNLGSEPKGRPAGETMSTPEGKGEVVIDATLRQLLVAKDVAKLDPASFDAWPYPFAPYGQTLKYEVLLKQGNAESAAELKAQIANAHPELRSRLALIERGNGPLSHLLPYLLYAKQILMNGF